MKVLVPSKSDEHLGALLESMEASQPGSTTAVYVGDNGISAAFKAKWWQPAYVPVPQPFVFAQAVNVLADASVPEDTLILGDDTRILHSEPWRQNVEAFFKDWPQEYGLLSLQIEGRGAGAVEDQKLGAAARTAAWAFKAQPSNWTVCFVAAMIPRAVWMKVGRMDERFIGYGHDDDDYCLRLWHLGYRVGVCSAATVWHGRGSYAEDYPGQRWETLYDLNAHLFREKWGIQRPGRKGLSCAEEHLCCSERPWHKMDVSHAPVRP